jgi:acetylglutamate kinase
MPATGLQSFIGRPIVVKIGGNSLADEPEFLPRLATELAQLQAAGVRIVLVHGGGPQIDVALAQAGLVPRKRADGRRITDAATMAIVASTMHALRATLIVTLQAAGCVVAAPPQSPVTAAPLDSAEDRIGKPIACDIAALLPLLESGHMPVLHSVASGRDGLDYNVNADDYALALAVALQAERLILATNVAGVWGADKQPLPVLTAELAATLIQQGVIQGGMIPKVESALGAVAAGVGGIAIIDGHRLGALTLALTAPQQVGTLVCSR